MSSKHSYGKNYYQDIDEMPLYNWRKCRAGKLKYTRKDLEVGKKKYDKKYWEKVHDTYLDQFGLGSGFIRYLELAIELAEANCDFVITDDRFTLNRIRELEREIEDLIKRGEEGGGMDVAVVYVSKWMNTMVNEREVTVKMFYTMLQEYEKEAKERAKQANKNK